MQNKSKFITIILLVIIIIVGSFKLFKSKQITQDSNVKEESIFENKNVSDKSTMKLYKNDTFSFLYDSNSEVKEIKDKDSSFFVIHVAKIGEKNTEKGIYVYLYVKGAQGSNFAEPCNKPTEIKGKMFCIVPANNGSDFTDGVYRYTKGNNQLQIAFSNQDTDALSDSRYIDLGSIEIY